QGADCWAVNQGVRQGWLDHHAIEQVCQDFGNRPASATHPSGARRCASLRQCFANASAAAARQNPAATRRPSWLELAGLVPEGRANKKAWAAGHLGTHIS